MDLVGFAEPAFAEIATAFATVAARLGEVAVCAIPLSARRGDNVTRRSPRMPWDQGPTLLEHLHAGEGANAAETAAFSFPVQWVNRPDAEFRGFSGTVAAGSIGPGDTVLVAGSGRLSTVKEIVTFDGALERARAGDAVTLTLADEIDIARGDLLGDPRDPPE